MNEKGTKPAESKWRSRLYEVIFEAETVNGKIFDVILLGMIMFSVAVVILESVKSVRDDYGSLLLGVE
jgi:voltage-gated potassium channel